MFSVGLPGDSDGLAAVQDSTRGGEGHCGIPDITRAERSRRGELGQSGKSNSGENGRELHDGRGRRGNEERSRKRECERRKRECERHWGTRFPTTDFYTQTNGVHRMGEALANRPQTFIAVF